MSRKLRFVPEPGLLFHVTNRCSEARYFLRPSRELNEHIVGVLGRAQGRTDVEVVTAVVLSNHFHLLIVVEDAKQLSDFMHFVDTNIAKEANRLLDRSGPFWQGRYHDTLIANEEEAQISILRYVLEQGCKEGLVESPLEWPGVHSSRASVAGEPMTGTWINRTALYKAGQRKGASTQEASYKIQETLQLSPLPCWKHLDRDHHRAKIQDLVQDIAQETRKRHRLAGTRPLGPRRICRRRPDYRPKAPKKSLTPLVRAATQTARQKLLEAYRTYVRHFREAAEHLKKCGDLSKFPPGSFPPGAPFVPMVSSLEPG